MCFKLQTSMLCCLRLLCFFLISELHEDHSMEVIMRSIDMTVFERISSFYSAPFTKFMGNLVSA